MRGLLWEVRQDEVSCGFLLFDTIVSSLTADFPERELLPWSGLAGVTVAGNAEASPRKCAVSGLQEAVQYRATLPPTYFSRRQIEATRGSTGSFLEIAVIKIWGGELLCCERPVGQNFQGQA